MHVSWNNIISSYVNVDKFMYKIYLVSCLIQLRLGKQCFQ
jgi:hypothetical protein